MGVGDRATRYREYLRSFGIAEAGDRVAELSDLDLRDVRFFAYAGGEGLRLKAAATPNGLVTPGGHAGDDWQGFLSGAPNAAAAAERIAWLETDESQKAHDFPAAPAMALVPDRPPPVGMDPAQWALVTPSRLVADPAGGVQLTAWLLPSGGHVPTRWTVTARAGAPAVIERASAFDLLVADAGSAAAAAAGAARRARALLASGTDHERWWALRHIGDTGDRTGVPEVAALLADPGASPEARLLAAGTLGRLTDPAGLGPLGAALRADRAPEVRRACAHALGRISDASAVEALAAAATVEPDVRVRAEIVHALAAQGRPARAALARIAGHDADAGVRELASHSLDGIQ